MLPAGAPPWFYLWAEATETGRLSRVLKAPLSPDAFIAGEMLHAREGLTRGNLRGMMGALKALVQREG